MIQSIHLISGLSDNPTRYTYKWENGSKIFRSASLHPHRRFPAPLLLLEIPFNPLSLVTVSTKQSWMVHQQARCSSWIMILPESLVVPHRLRIATMVEVVVEVVLLGSRPGIVGMVPPLPVLQRPRQPRVRCRWVWSIREWPMVRHPSIRILVVVVYQHRYLHHHW